MGLYVSLCVFILYAYRSNSTARDASPNKDRKPVPSQYNGLWCQANIKYLILYIKLPFLYMCISMGSYVSSYVSMLCLLVQNHDLNCPLQSETEPSSNVVLWLEMSNNTEVFAP